jgi:hypothetical protein
MSALPPLKRFSAEDYADAPGWVSKFFYPLNLFLSSVYTALNNGLTFKENILSQVKVVSTDGTAPASGKPKLQFPWSFPAVKPIGCLIISATDTSSSPSPITTALGIDWSYSQGFININNIAGLDAAKTYSLTFLVIGG